MISGAECGDQRDGLVAPMYMSNRFYKMATSMQVNWKSHFWAWWLVFCLQNACNIIKGVCVKRMRISGVIL